MENIIILAILALILGGAVGYIRKAKESGRKCIGCPDACSCSAKNGSQGCGCGWGGE